jgi:hypothetical protein
VSIRAVPKISPVCQESPDNDPAGLRGSELSKSKIVEGQRSGWTTSGSTPLNDQIAPDC